MKILPQQIKAQSKEFGVSENDIRYLYSQTRAVNLELYKKLQSLIHNTREIDTKKYYGKKRNFLEAVYSFDSELSSSMENDSIIPIKPFKERESEELGWAYPLRTA